MKKILAIIIVAMVASVFAFAGCQKQEAAQPAVVTAPTATMTAPAAPAAAPATAPEHK